MNDDDFFSDFDELDIISNSVEEPNNDDPVDDSVDDTTDSPDLITILLKDRGISDINNIQFEDEEGIVSNKTWDELSIDEKRTILNQSSDYDPESEPDDDEIDLLNAIRESGLTPQQYLQTITQDAINGVQSQYVAPEQSYYVDDLSDEELFVLDLQAKSEDITEDEARQALEAAMANESLWKKQMAGIRNEYKILEQNKLDEEEAERQELQQQEFKQFSGNIINNINSLNSFGELDIALANEDKEELAEFILGKDESGVSHFSKALNDPETLVQMAWFALHGEDTFNEINRYMSEQLRHATQAAYNKGLNEGKAKSGHLHIQQKNNKSSDFDSLDDITF